MTTFDLFSSVRDGNTDIVRHLLQSKNCRARLNHRNEWGDTALHLAAEAGNGEICQMLIAAGASVTVRNNRGETCLHRAAVGGHVASVSAIVGELNTSFTFTASIFKYGFFIYSFLYFNSFHTALSCFVHPLTHTLTLHTPHTPSHHTHHHIPSHHHTSHYTPSHLTHPHRA